jgi:hypothetical protein
MHSFMHWKAEKIHTHHRNTMDKPELPIRVKTVQHSFSATDAQGHTLSAVCEITRTLDEQEFTKQIDLELVRCESPERSRLRLKRALYRADVALVLTATDKVLTLLQMREHRQEKAPRNGIEFFVNVFDSLKIGAIEFQGKDPLYFIELSTKGDDLRFQFAKIDDWDAFKEVLRYAH